MRVLELKRKCLANLKKSHGFARGMEECYLKEREILRNLENVAQRAGIAAEMGDMLGVNARMDEYGSRIADMRETLEGHIGE
jgi:hypothetical protein